MAEQSWTDDPITAGSDRIKKKSTHFTELQDAINAWETAYNITNSNLTASPDAGVQIDSTAIIEMQNALDDLYQLVDSTSFIWTEAPIITSTVKPTHINELRTNMNVMQNDYCHVCDSCDTDTGCNLCNMVCDEDDCAQCFTSCYGYSACSCNASCHGYSACSCVSACYSQGCKGDSCNCVVACYGQSGCSCNATCHGYSDCTCDNECNINACDQCDVSCNEDTCAHCDNSTYRYPWT